MSKLLDYLDKLAKPVKEFGICATKKQVIKLQDKLKYLKDKDLRDDPYVIAEIEKKLLGIAITSKRLDAYNDNRITHTCKDFFTATPNQELIVGVDIDRKMEWVTKSGESEGKKRADLLVSDSTAKIKVKVWSDQYEGNEHLLIEGNFLILKLVRGYGKYEQFAIAKEIIKV